MEIQNANREKADIDQQLKELKAKMDAAPEVERQYQALNQSLILVTTRYNELKKEEGQTQTTANLEERGLGEMLEMVDPANLPQNPSDPNRYAITGAGLALGLMLGLGLAGAREAKDTSLKNLKDVRAYTNLPVLTSIPLLESALLVRRRRRLAWLGWSSAVVLGVLAMALAVFYYYTPHATQ